jgi:hypothetical protein
MQNETNHLSPPSPAPERKHSPARAGFSECVPLLAKCIVMVPMVMVLLGAELELRLSPKLNVILTGAVAWGMWAWLSGTSRPER